MILANNLHAQSIDISSDKLTIDRQSKTACFSGKVQITFEDIILIAKKIKIHYDDISDKHSISKIEIIGNFKALQDDHIILANGGGIYDLTTKELKIIDAKICTHNVWSYAKEIIFKNKPIKKLDIIKL